MYWASRVPWTLSSATTRKNAAVAVFGLPPTLFVSAAFVAEPVIAASLRIEERRAGARRGAGRRGTDDADDLAVGDDLLAAVAATAGSSVESAGDDLESCRPSFAPMFLTARLRPRALILAEERGRPGVRGEHRDLHGAVAVDRLRPSDGRRASSGGRCERRGDQGHACQHQSSTSFHSCPPSYGISPRCETPTCRSCCCGHQSQSAGRVLSQRDP